MIVTIYLCQVCDKHFSIQDADPHSNFCPVCPICVSADDVLEKSIGTLAELHKLHQGDDDES